MSIIANPPPSAAEPPLRERLRKMRAELIVMLEADAGIEPGWLSLLADVQTGIDAIDAAERDVETFRGKSNG